MKSSSSKTGYFNIVENHPGKFYAKKKLDDERGSKKMKIFGTGKGTPREAAIFLAEYLDSPFDINDRGVAHIVTDQVRKLRPLLEEALQKRELPPVAVQTVCSGTDAPAIALGLASKDLQPELAFKVPSHSVDRTLG